VAIYELTANDIRRLEPTSFAEAQIRERADLQRLLRGRIGVLSSDDDGKPDLLVIAEEFGEWTESRRRIDLLALDRAANLVVIELKRVEDGGHMELQAIRYAAMVSTMTFEQADKPAKQLYWVEHAGVPSNGQTRWSHLAATFVILQWGFGR